MPKLVAEGIGIRPMKPFQARHPYWLGSDDPAVQKLAPQLPG